MNIPVKLGGIKVFAHLCISKIVYLEIMRKVKKWILTRGIFIVKVKILVQLNYKCTYEIRFQPNVLLILTPE